MLQRYCTFEVFTRACMKLSAKFRENDMFLIRNSVIFSGFLTREETVGSKQIQWNITLRDDKHNKWARWHRYKSPYRRENFPWQIFFHKFNLLVCMANRWQRNQKRKTCQWKLVTGNLPRKTSRKTCQGKLVKENGWMTTC